MKKIIALLLSVLFLLSVVSCGKNGEEVVTKLSFKTVASYDYLKTLDGEKVTINGYLATSSPVDGSFIFLMNLPYQNCPFCKPNTSQLSNTLEVYPRKGKSFDYTNQAVKVTGELKVAAEGETFTDNYGYEFVFKIVNADYVILKDSDISADTALWQKIANSGIITEIYSMFDYLNFLCCWGSYTAKFTGGEDYLFPTDLDGFCFNEGAQYNYGYQSGYFDGIITKINQLSPDLGDLADLVQECKELAEEAVSDIQLGMYSRVEEYSLGSDGNLYFGDGRQEYKMDDDTLNTRNENLYNRFYAWFSSWEM